MTIQALLRPSAEESVLVNDQCLTAVHYIEVLMENFIPGQQALEGHLPMGKLLCVVGQTSSFPLCLHCFHRN